MLLVLVQPPPDLVADGSDWRTWVEVPVPVIWANLIPNEPDACCVSSITSPLSCDAPQGLSIVPASPIPLIHHTPFPLILAFSRQGRRDNAPSPLTGRPPKADAVA